MASNNVVLEDEVITNNDRLDNINELLSSFNAKMKLDDNGRVSFHNNGYLSEQYRADFVDTKRPVKTISARFFVVMTSVGILGIKFDGESIDEGVPVIETIAIALSDHKKFVMGKFSNTPATIGLIVNGDKLDKDGKEEVVETAFVSLPETSDDKLSEDTLNDAKRIPYSDAMIRYYSREYLENKKARKNER